MMRLRDSLLFFCSGVAAFAATGCGGTGSAVPSAVVQTAAQRAHPAWWRVAPATARAGVYVAQTNGAGDGVVFGYGTQNRRNAGPSCSIAGQSFEQTQIAADARGRLYLPDVSAGTIRIYAPVAGSCFAPSATRTDPTSRSR